MAKVLPEPVAKVSKFAGIAIRENSSDRLSFHFTACSTIIIIGLASSSTLESCQTQPPIMQAIVRSDA